MNLSQYVQNLLFLENLGDDISDFFDEVVLLCIDKKLALGDVKIPVSFWDGKSSTSMLSSGKRPLYLADEYALVHLDNALWQQDVVIVNLFTGMSSFSHKYSPEIEDITSVIHQKIPVCEAYDLLSLLGFLRLGGSRYIRLSAEETPSKLFLDEKDTWTEYSLLSMDRFGMGGEEATILCGGNVLSILLQSVAILQEQKVFVDVYSVLNYQFNLRDDLRNSLERSKKLIVVVDQLVSDDFEKLFRDKFVEIDGLQISFLSPDYASITSYVQEFRPDQARFDQVSLMERILGEIKK